MFPKRIATRVLLSLAAIAVPPVSGHDSRHHQELLTTFAII
jgi:hypothetical protein